MSIKARRIYLSILIVFFLIIAPVLLFYAGGWRYNFNEKQLEKVGAFSLVTEPRGAKLYVNDKLVNKKTPLTMQNMLPGKYQLAVSKESYYTWQGQVSIESGKGVNLSKLYLLKEPTIKTFTNEKTVLWSISEDKLKIASSANGLLKIQLLENFSKIYENELTGKITGFSWSASSNKLLILDGENQYWIANIQSNGDMDRLFDIFDLEVGTAWWSDSDDNVLFALQGEELYRLNYFQKTKTLLMKFPNIKTASEDFFITSDQSGTTIFDYDQKKITATTNLSANIALERLTNNLWALFDQQSDELMLFNGTAIDELQEKVSSYFWNNANKQMLYLNEHELWLWDAVKNEKNLLLRTSDSIRCANFINNGHLVIFSTSAQGLRVMETQESLRNIYNLDIEAVNSLLATENGEVVAGVADEKIYQISF